MKTRYGIAALGVALMLACGGSSSGGDGGVGGNGSGTARVQGRVGEYVPASDAGTPTGTVSVYKISSAGTLTRISNPAAVSASGTYSASVSFTGGAPSDVLVGYNEDGGTSGAAPDGGTVASNTINSLALVSAPLTAGGTVTAPPCNARSGAQVDVALWERANGHWSSTDNDAQLELTVDTIVSDWLSNSLSYLPDIAAAGAAAASSMDARAAVLSNATVGGASQDQLTAFYSAETSAQIQEDLALSSARSQSDVDTAISTRQTAEETGAADAGIDLGAMARAEIAASHATAAAIGNASTDVRASVILQAEAREASAVELANFQSLQALGATSTALADIEGASTNLNNALAVSTGSSTSITAAWSTYQAAISLDVNGTLDASRSGSATAMSTVVSGQSGALTSLNSSVAAAGGNAASLATAYAAYMASVKAAVSANATLSQYSAAQQAAIVTLILDAKTSG